MQTIDSAGFPFEMNFKYSYSVESVEVDFKTTRTEYGDYMLTASQQKFSVIGSHNFMYYKKAQYRNASGEMKDCFYFIFYYQLGRPQPEMKANGILVIEKNGTFVFSKQVESDMGEKSKFTTRMERKGDEIIVSYINETKKKPETSTFTVKSAEDDVFLDENFIYTFAVFLKLKNPYDKELFTWRAFVPGTYITQKNMIISSPLSWISQVMKAHSLYNQPLFIKEDALGMHGESSSTITTEFFDLKFVRKGNDSFNVAGKNISTRMFVCTELGITINVDEEGNLIRLTIPGKRFTLIEMDVVSGDGN